MEVIDVKFRTLPSWRRGRGEGPRMADRPDRRRVPVDRRRSASYLIRTCLRFGLEESHANLP
jgi:hypothetical protein